MSNIAFFREISKKDVAIAGGKGASLGEMTKAKIPVPPGFVVLSGAFDRFLEETDLNAGILAELKKVKIDDTNSIDRASNVIRDMIHDHAMPADLEKEILAAWDELGGTEILNQACLPDRQVQDDSGKGKRGMLVAVRSSATAEDGAVASWAGELDTFLNIDRAGVVDAVRRCWSSLFTARAIFYRHDKKLIDHYVSVAVVVQTMVQSEIAGIAFTVHPVTEDRNQMIIEAGLGLGEAVVSGQITPDSYVVLKKEMEILDINVGEQERMLVRGKGKEERGKQGDNALSTFRIPHSANQWVKCGAAGNKQKLTGTQIIELAKICKQIEAHYKFPCDIEWAYAGGKFYITQSRPITTLKNK